MSADSHTRHLESDCADVPDDVRAQVMGHLGNVGTYASRGELAEAIEASYAAVGAWEDFLVAEGQER